MQMFKRNYSSEEVLNGARIGFEFEFYSDMDHVKTARDIAKYLKKRVIVPMSVSVINKPKPMYHSPIVPTANIFKLEPDYSGGKKMCELVTGPMPYDEARNVMIKMFDWISSNGYTTERCSIHANISFDKEKLPTRNTVQTLNLLKFILDFDENKVYQAFPDRKDSVYARSIKSIKPNDIFFFSPNNINISQNNYTLPSEKYFGVNFTKKEKGYLEYRYMGGKDYEKKTRKVLDLLEYFIIHLHTTLNFTEYTAQDEKFFKELLAKHAKSVKGFIRYADFKKTFPKVEVTVDLNGDDTVVEAYWNNIREKVYELVNGSQMTKGKYNYDSELSKHQVMGAKLKDCDLSDFEIVASEVEGRFHGCTFYKCTVKNSRIEFCDAPIENVFLFSKLENVPLHVTNRCEDCYIENKNKVINCEVIRGVVRTGEIGKLAKISDDTFVIDGVDKKPL